MKMSCRFYEKFFLGQITESAFKKHIKRCQECQLMVEQDEQVESMVRDMKNVFHPDVLWNNIESSLIREKEKKERDIGVQRMTYTILRMAAIIIITILTGIIVNKKYFHSSVQLLSDKSVQQYMSKEKKYMSVIEDLEKNVQFSLSDGNIDKQFRYKEYLETMDSQIRDYHDVLLKNPANAHIRSYLIKALRDKKQILEEFAREKKNNLSI